MPKTKIKGKGFLYVVLAICICLAALNAGCWRDNEPRLLVFAAASLAEPLEEIRKHYQAESFGKVEISYGGSQTLAQQIANGAPADILISAGNLPINFLERQGRIRYIEELALTNEIVIATDVNMHLTSIHDLTDSKFKRVALPDPALAPAGVYIQSALKQAGIWVELNPKIIMGADASATTAILRTGNVDVALVYFTDVQKRNDVKIHKLFPKESYPPINYPVGFIEGSEHFDLASTFIAYVQGPQSLEVFQNAGFSVK